jgi:hypothetical protein
MGLLRTILAIIAGVIGLILLMPLFVLVIPFWCVSFLTHCISRMIEPRFLTRDQLIEFDPIFGWKPRPNLNTYHLMVDLFHLTTDAHGWRGNSSLEDSDIVVFGDSFAAGYGVSDRQFFANLKGTPGIKPIGIGGYCLVQELLWMQRLAPQLQGKLIVWFIYYGNDLYDNLVPDLRGYRKPFLRKVGKNGDWEIVSSHVTPEPWPIVTQTRMQGENHLPRLAELCSHTFLAKRAYSACEYLLGEGKQVCNEAGADLTILTIPDSCQLTSEGRSRLQALGGDQKTFDVNIPDRELAAICQRLDIGFVAGKTFLNSNCYKTNDCHWNAHGHRKVAEALARLYHSRSQLSALKLKGAKVLVQA